MSPLPHPRHDGIGLSNGLHDPHSITGFLKELDLLLFDCHGLSTGFGTMPEEFQHVLVRSRLPTTKRFQNNRLKRDVRIRRAEASYVLWSWMEKMFSFCSYRTPADFPISIPRPALCKLLTDCKGEVIDTSQATAASRDDSRA